MVRLKQLSAALIPDVTIVLLVYAVKLANLRIIFSDGASGMVLEALLQGTPQEITCELDVLNRAGARGWTGTGIGVAHFSKGPFESGVHVSDWSSHRQQLVAQVRVVQPM